MIIAAGIILLALTLLVIRDVGRWMGRRFEILVARSEDQMEGHPFDTSSVAPRIHAVRQDYLAEMQAREHHAEFHDDLLVAARSALRRLSFFRDRPPVDLNEPTHLHSRN